jgi:hypothetical protein
VEVGVTDAGTRYGQALEAFDPDLIAAALSDDVTIHVAAHDQPLVGKDTAAVLFGVLTQELTPFALVEEIVEGLKSVVVVETSLRGKHAHGLNVVSCGADGLVQDLAAFFRPLALLQFIADVIGTHMAERFGPSRRA